MIFSFTESHMMTILNIYVLFFMSYVMHICLVTLRSAPLALMEYHFMVMLPQRRALRWMKQRLLLS
jgi:hypothetical protein